MAYKFKQSDYDAWLKAKYGNNIPKDTAGIEAARIAYLNEIILPLVKGDDAAIKQAVTEFTKAKPISQANLETIITPFLSANSQMSPTAPQVGGGGVIPPASVTTPTTTTLPTSAMDEVVSDDTSRTQRDAVGQAAAKIKQQDVASGVSMGLGALKGLTGIGQAIGGKNTLKNLVLPKAPQYQTNQLLDTEIAKAQQLAETGDPTLIEMGQRDIANRTALANEQARMVSGGDVSAYGAGVAGNNVAGMNAMRALIGDVNQQKRMDRGALQSLIGQKTADNQFKQQADFRNVMNFEMPEYLRKGQRAESMLNAGVQNAALGVQGITDGGLNLTGRKEAMERLMSQYDMLTPQQQAEMRAKYPKLFGVTGGRDTGRNVSIPVPNIPSSILTK